MRRRLRVFRAWLDGQPVEPHAIHFPIIDDEGERCWAEVLYAPSTEEAQMMVSTSDTYRAAYHIIATTNAREATEQLGVYHAVGWEA